MHKLPLSSAQILFGLESQRVGRKASVSLMFRTVNSRVSSEALRKILESMIRNNPALSYRVRFSRGSAYQECVPGPLDFAELSVRDEVSVWGRVIDITEEFDADLLSAPFRARLIRSPSSDFILLIIDHALVDEQSLALITRQLDAGAQHDGDGRQCYAAAVADYRSREVAAAEGPGIDYWNRRLRGREGPAAAAREIVTRVIPSAEFPDTVVPESFRGSLFPVVLFSLHRALRDVLVSEPSAVIYPWGARNPEFSDVVGCFMNSVISVDAADRHDTSRAVTEFVNQWYDDIDHAHVPFNAVTALDPTYSKLATAQLSFTHDRGSAIRIAGVEVVRVAPRYGRTSRLPEMIASATVRQKKIHLRLLLDEDRYGCSPQELGHRWRHWITTVLAESPEPVSASRRSTERHGK